MSKSKKLRITCDEATMICDKNQYNEASFIEKIQLKIHLLMCKYCSLYVQQNKTLSTLFKAKANSCKHPSHHISSEDKILLKKQFNERNH